MSHKLPQPVTRRDALCRMGSGFGMLAFASLIGESLAAAGIAEGPQQTGESRAARSSGARQARHLPLHERRRVAGGQLRSEADARQVPRAAAARRHRGHRTQDRHAAQVAVHLQEIRTERHRSQRALPERRRVRGRHLLRALGLHRHSESRAVDAHDEHGPYAGRPSVDRRVAHVRARLGEQESAGLRRAVSGRADHGRPAALEQRVSAGRAPGHVHLPTRSSGRIR